MIESKNEDAQFTEIARSLEKTKGEDKSIANVMPNIIDESNQQSDKPIRWSKCYQEVIITALTYSSIFSLTSVSGFVCAFFMKEIDLENFEAAVLINAQRNGMILLFFSPLYTISSLVAQYTNSNKSIDEIARLQQAGWIVSAITFIPAVVVCAASKQIFILLGVPKHIASIAQPFFWAFIPGAVAASLQTGSLQFPGGLNKRAVIILIDLIVLGLSIGLTRIFALGAGKFPRLGALGYGYAQSIASGAYLLMILLLFAFKNEFKKYHLYQPRWHWLEEVLKILKFGLPNTAASLGEVALFYAMPFFAESLSNSALAAQGIISFYAGLIIISSLSFFRTNTILIGGALGGKKLKDIPRYIMANFSLCLIIPLIGLILTSTIPNQLADAFLVGVPISLLNDTLSNYTNINLTQMNDSDSATIFRNEVYSKLKAAFPIAALGSLFDAIRITFIGALIGLNAVKMPGIINLFVQLVIILPLMYVLARHTSLGLAGMHFAYILGGLILSGVMLYNLYKWHPSQDNVSNNNIELEPNLNSNSANSANNFIAAQSEEQENNQASLNMAEKPKDVPPIFLSKDKSLTQKSTDNWWGCCLSWFPCGKSATKINISSSAKEISDVKLDNMVLMEASKCI